MHTDRYVPLHPHLKTLLDEWLANRADWQMSDLLFTDRGRPIPQSRVDRAVQRAATAASIGHVHPHQLRHTLATQAVNRGMSPEALPGEPSDPDQICPACYRQGLTQHTTEPQRVPGSGSSSNTPESSTSVGVS
jgi:integrase